MSSGIMTVAARNRLKTIQCLGIFRYIVLQRDHISKEWFYIFQDFSCQTLNIYVSMEQKTVTFKHVLVS